VPNQARCDSALAVFRRLNRLFGRVRITRYRTTLGSARETLSCLRVAEAFGYVEAMPKALLERMNCVIGTLVRVAV
jgi:hypothetical protein